MKNKKIIINAYEKIRTEIRAYFFVKFWISLVSALISYLIMLLFNLNFSAFWAVLIFILNFIPNIGSIIAISLPAILSFVQVQPSFTLTDSLVMISLLVLLDQFM
ncbi:MAG: AI-2E family transporter [Candidatus Peribacteria bacterium]|jgi:predicted PurR-regulated permease PerM|nr:AI-2E family transporter [Candidatus Peribacteria bacterium]